jgi:hypothetical protein
MNINFRSPTGAAKSASLCAVSLFFLFLGFYRNSWQVADQQWFNNHQVDTESLVIARIVKSQQDGIFSAGGLPGLGSLNNIPVDTQTDPFWVAFQYGAYIQGIKFGAFTPYKSQIGGQGLLFSMLDRLISLSPEDKLSLFQALTSLFSALALTMIILWFYWEVGLSSALFVLFSAVLSQWLVVFGRNLWWSLWAFYLPMAVMMHYLRRNRVTTKRRNITVAVLVFLTVFIKCLFNGYEYVTTTLLMMLVPFVYYGVLDKAGLLSAFRGLFAASFASILAILLSFIILCFQIASVDGGFLKGVDHILFSFQKRTHADPEKFLDPEYVQSLKAHTTDVVATYLNGTFIDFGNYLPAPNSLVSRLLYKVTYKKLIVLFLAASVFLYYRRYRYVSECERQSRRALIFAVWVSLLAPLSWFIIFKAHSFVHPHMNYIVWQMPFTLFGFALCGLAVKSFASGHGAQSRVARQDDRTKSGNM